MTQCVMVMHLFYCSPIFGSVNASVRTPYGHSKFHCRRYIEWKRADS